MILAVPVIHPERSEITKAILDNKVLIYSVYIAADHIVAEGRLFTIREMLRHPEIKADPPETVAELVQRYKETGAAFEASYNIGDRELAEAVFDQETGDKRADRLCDVSNECDGDVSNYAQFGLDMIGAFMKRLPEKADYADELLPM